MDEAVFKAIDDPARRRLLDALHERDGQTLVELTSLLPTMTRQGVMNHLRVLADADLVTSTKVGRERFHYLNPVPIQLIGERWISKYAAPRVDALVALQDRLEKGHAMDTADTTQGGNDSKPVHRYQAYIQAPIDDVWQAIVDPDQTVQYFYGTRVECDWEVGSEMNYRGGDGELVSTGALLAIDAPKRLELTFTALWDPKLTEEGACREVWALREVNGMTELTIELYDIVEGGAIHQDFAAGLPYIVSGLKSLLETGKPLPPPY